MYKLELLKEMIQEEFNLTEVGFEVIDETSEPVTFGFDNNSFILSFWFENDVFVIGNIEVLKKGNSIGSSVVKLIKYIVKRRVFFNSVQIMLNQMREDFGKKRDLLREREIIFI